MPHIKIHVHAAHNDLGHRCVGITAQECVNGGKANHRRDGLDDKKRSIISPDAVHNAHVVNRQGLYPTRHTGNGIRGLAATEQQVPFKQLLGIGRQMDNARSAMNIAWERRQATYDILSQKNSDAILGYDRLYDSETGEIYRAESGFYDSYDLHRNEYSNPNLQLIDDQSKQYYLNGIDYYITR